MGLLRRSSSAQTGLITCAEVTLHILIHLFYLYRALTFSQAFFELYTDTSSRCHLDDYKKGPQVLLVSWKTIPPTTHSSSPILALCSYFLFSLPPILTPTFPTSPTFPAFLPLLPSILIPTLLVLLLSLLLFLSYIVLFLLLSTCLSACFCWRSLRSFGSTQLLTSFACPARSALHALLYLFVLR